MSETANPLPPLTAEDFKGWANHNGVDLVEDESATWVIAYGHIDPADYAAAVNAYDVEAAGMPADDPDAYTAADVRHAYAVTKTPAPEWWVTFHNVTSETPGAFPITIVSR